MPDHLLQQYEFVRQSRAVMLDFVEQYVKSDLNTPVPAFDGKTIRYLLVHNVNVYRGWLDNFAMQGSLNSHDDVSFTTISDILPLFTRTDELVKLFLTTFAESMSGPITGKLSDNRQISLSPLQLFTHVITHEFHHKGQIMTMCRLLGYPPPDTDLIRT